MLKKLLISFAFLFSLIKVYGQTLNIIKPSNKKIHYCGRIDYSDKDNLKFSYPGVSIKAKFEGTSISANLSEYGSGTKTTTNYLNVIIDNGKPIVLKLSKDKEVYKLATGLNDGVHTIELFKRTESTVGKVGFRGFILDEGKKLLNFGQIPELKIEFIGNSITCGYGNEISTNEPNNYNFTSVNENNYKAWGAITARKINALYSCVAFSGRGLFQNNTGAKEGTLPEIYDRIFPDEPKPLWEHSKYIPDIVVINLGTNDFYAETTTDKYHVDSINFVRTHIAFICKLRTYYPEAKFICCVGTMMSDNYPQGKQQWTRIQNYVSSVKAHLNSKGDKEVYYLKLEPQTAPYGEDWHPSHKTHRRMANKLTELINTLNFD